MPTIVERDEVTRLVAAGGQLVDVLPQAEYDAEHIAGAVSIPLKKLDRQAAEGLDRGRPVITYCWDLQ